MKTLLMQPVSRPISGTIRPPGSKSLTNRALVLAALAEGTTQLTGVLHSRDTEVMLDSLQRLGFSITPGETATTLYVTGQGGRIPASQAELYLENSGTSIRFLTALCALGHGRYRLDGNARMRERPIRELIDALRPLGVQARDEYGNGCPPVLVESQGMTGGMTTLLAHRSSQFLSALLMAAPAAKQSVTIRLQGEVVSEPYIDMTLGVMARFGVTVDHSETGVFRIQPQRYRAGKYEIEPDASAASYFLAAAAITGGEVTIQGLSQYALQGDVRFVEVLEQMGCRAHWHAGGVTLTAGTLRGIDVDMNAISDTAPTLAAVAVFADGPTRIHHVGHMRLKETDRITALATELRRLGVQVDEFADGLLIHPTPPHAATIHTYDDHRMAMSFALVGLRVPGIVICDPECTAKTYPEFFADLDRLCRSARSA
ncbi:MAG: 3-phosphoshikimate 1-carboxyvinyltransferase [Planctomycetaceae bacterium]|nr:MAG: 3-phosphoshikimate 1-carboxyvinyltransferase [Planctomycetaceae bacterium]